MLQRVLRALPPSVLLLILSLAPLRADAIDAAADQQQDFPRMAEQRSWVGTSLGRVTWPWRYREALRGSPPSHSEEGNSRNLHLGRNAVASNGLRFAGTHSSYTRHHAGRRVCTRRMPNSVPHHRGAGQIRFIYTELTSSFSCCPGWAQVSRVSFGCNKPACAVPCSNGGTCTSPGRCACPRGYTGSQCETDVDECVTEKPCDQYCKNLPGTYECFCRAGYQLQLDGQSCRKNGSVDTAFEARDLERDFHEFSASTTTPKTTEPEDVENEVTGVDLDQDYEVILKRLAKLEKQVAKGKRKEAKEANESNDMTGRLSFAIESINEMRKAIDNVQLMQQELYDMRSKMKQYELEARKVRHLTNRVVELEDRLRTRCGTLLPINAGSLNF